MIRNTKISEFAEAIRISRDCLVEWWKGKSENHIIAKPALIDSNDYSEMSFGSGGFILRFDVAVCDNGNWSKHRLALIEAKVVEQCVDGQPTIVCEFTEIT